MLLIDNLREALHATKKQKNVVTVVSVPIVKINAWSWTPEACLNFTKPTREAVFTVFNSLDQETQKRFAFIPGCGEWPKRARFWKEHLRELPPDQRNEAMIKILAWMIKCLRRRAERSANNE